MISFFPQIESKSEPFKIHLTYVKDVIFASSYSNFLYFLNKDHSLFKIQISSQNILIKFVHISSDIREYAVQPNFFACISNDGSFSINKKKIDLDCPRGLGYSSHFLTVASKSNEIHYFYFPDETTNYLHFSSFLPNHSIFQTAVVNDIIYILTTSGLLFSGNFDIDNPEKEICFTKMTNISTYFLKLYQHNDSLFAKSIDQNFYQIQNGNFVKIEDKPYNIHSLSDFNSELVFLSEEGILHYHSFKKRSDISGFSCFTIFQNFIACFSGNISQQTYSFLAEKRLGQLPLQKNIFPFTVDNIVIYGFDSTTFYASKENLNKHTTNQKIITPYMTLNDFIQLYCQYGAYFNNRPLYMTYEHRFIEIIETLDSFSFNLIPGDVVETPDGIIAIFIGISAADQKFIFWLKQEKSPYIFAIMEPLALNLIERPSHILKHAEVDGNHAIIDVTPSFCTKFYFNGRIGDLLWVPFHGIVEFAGAYKNRPIFHDYSNNSLFSAENAFYPIVRAFKANIQEHLPKKKKLPFLQPRTTITRKMKTFDGKIVNLDVTADNRIFMPTDRVQTPEGYATLVGYGVNDGLPYVLTDAAYFSDSGVKPINIFELSLIRRIGIKAVSCGHDISTKYRYYGAMAGDIIKSNGDVYIVRYVSNDGLNCQKRNSQKNEKAVNEKEEMNDQSESTSKENVMELIRDFELVYRADILGGEQSQCEVGSPAFSISNLVPGDEVKSESDGSLLTFKGLSKGGPLFLSESSRDVFVTSFTPLIMSSSFIPLKRPAFPDELMNSM